jgi:hypothetical protein
MIIPLSMLLMIFLLICLIDIVLIIDKRNLSFREKFFIRLPFIIYFGWITVATIANATTLLVSLGWDGLGLSQSLWTVIVLIAGMLLGTTVTIRFKSVAYALTLIWAYTGILIKHTSSTGFANQYTDVIVTVSICIAIFAATALYVLIAGKNKQISR